MAGEDAKCSEWMWMLDGEGSRGGKEGLGDVRHFVSFAADGKCDYCGKSDGTKAGTSE